MRDSSQLASPSSPSADSEPPSGQTAPAVQGGGSSPGICVSPALAGTGAVKMAATSKAEAQNESDLFIESSPCVEVVSVSGRAPAVTVHSTPPDPEDLERYRAFMSGGDFGHAKELCRERLLTARDPLTAHRWTKDRAIVAMAEGRAGESYDLLASVNYIAESLDPLRRGKHVNSFGVTLRMLGRYRESGECFGAAVEFCKQGGDVLLSAGALHNLGRLRAIEGRPDRGLVHLDSAANVARTLRDDHLLGEVLESRALALYFMGRHEEAGRECWESICLLKKAGDAVAVEESKRTQRMILDALTVEGRL